MYQKKTKIIVTLGPATNTEQDLRALRDKGVDFVRVNMSHSSLQDLEYFIHLAAKVGIPFIIDTEGSQVRTGNLDRDIIYFNENDSIKIYNHEMIGNSTAIDLKPGHVVAQLEPGDLIHVDFDTLILQVMDVSTIGGGYVSAKAVSGGSIGRNKAVVIDPAFKKIFQLPSLSPKDYQSIALGLREGIEHIAVSFVRSGAVVDEVRSVTQAKMKIISKVECVDALEHLDEIIQKSDYILIDRGDLSKEIPIEKIPFTQAVILQKAKRYETGVFVATNLLETMVEKRKPTRAEVHDVVNTIVDGAYGLTLAAETAIGKYPLSCVNMLNKLIQHTELVVDHNQTNGSTNGIIEILAESNYLNENVYSSLINPHGGKLINRVLANKPEQEYLNQLPRIPLDRNKQMDLEQIASGTYSPLEGFMGQEDFLSVVNHMRLSDGTVWPLPITLDVSHQVADRLEVGQVVGLSDGEGDLLGLLHLEEKFGFNPEETAQKIYGTTDLAHPGVAMVYSMQPILLGGKIDLIMGRKSDSRAYELTPLQLRGLFEERGWIKVLGFHTRNVIHRVHEFMQLTAMAEENCDGLLLHPVIGKKKIGDYEHNYIIKSYERMISQFYPKDKVVLAAFSTFSRYAGPREALFTALCRKNFGCSHFIVGRDHAGVGTYYDPHASHQIFDQFPEIGIKAVKFDEVVYSQQLNQYINKTSSAYVGSEPILHISGTQAREMLLRGERPPSWFMRPEISKIILDAQTRGEHVFVQAE